MNLTYFAANSELFMGPTGWICPKCGKVWAPHIAECSACNSAVTSIGSSSSPSPFEQTLEHLANHPPFGQK